MRGKIVNLCIGFMNVLFGALLLIYTIYVPQDKTLLTIQENTVSNAILMCIHVVLVIVFFINLIQYYNHIKDNSFKTGYMFALFVISFFVIKQPAIATFTIVSGMIVIYKSLKENLVELDSTTAISVTALLMVAIMALMGLSLSYKEIGEYIKDKENENEQAFTSTYFRYITELGINDIFINLKRDGKYGYINQNGDVVIDFKYDYASPFIKIVQYGKTFDIALVCENGSSYIILKNQRVVMSYRTESADNNYAAKLSELENIYTNTLKQTLPMQTEAMKITNNISRVSVYEEENITEYTYRYDYNQEYDLIITKSNLGLGDKYELAKKENLNIRMELDANQLAYDEKYLYLFSNGTIPFYNISNREQGWFTSYGTKKTMTGRAQILDFFGDKILIRNYNDKTVYFIDENGETKSPAYKNIYVTQDASRYIVKNMNGKYSVVNPEYNKVFNGEYDILDPYLANYGLYIVANNEEKVEFNEYNFAKMKFMLLDSNGDIILDNIEQIYGNYYQISNDETVSYSSRYAQFIENLKTLEYEFVGDEFYSVY